MTRRAHAWVAAAILLGAWLMTNAVLVLRTCGLNGRGYWVPWHDEVTCTSIDVDRLPEEP